MNNISLKPIIKWSGGKSDEIKEIIPHIPENYDTYLEPFIGGGAVYFHINPNKAVINDVHKELIDFYQSIKNGNSYKIYDFMDKHPNNEETYYKVRAFEFNEYQYPIHVPETDIEVHYQEYKCNKCHFITTYDDPNCNQCKSTYCMLALPTIDLCENTDCYRFPDDWDFDNDTQQTYQDGQWKKCNICDGYFQDNGFDDILFIEEKPNNYKHSCDLCGKTNNIVQLKGTSQYICSNACEENDDLDHQQNNIANCDICCQDRKFNEYYLFKRDNKQELYSCINCWENHETKLIGDTWTWEHCTFPGPAFIDIEKEKKDKEILDNAKRFYYLRKTCYRGMLRYNKKGQFNIPFGRYKNCNYEDLKNKEYENLLKKTDIFNTSFEDIFENYNHENNFMFLDPPYDSEFTDYGYCTFGKDQQRTLAKCFKETKIKCLIIIGKTPFIEELYKDYIVGEYDKKYRFKLHSGRVGDEINTKHLIIKNY
jgi:DNA adenine methylase Dam